MILFFSLRGLCLNKHFVKRLAFQNCLLQKNTTCAVKFLKFFIKPAKFFFIPLNFSIDVSSHPSL